MGQYTIHGRDGLWEVVSGYLAEETIVLIFQNIGSGEFVEVELCPFEMLIDHKQIFKKWDS
jgi:hypothetical protein